MISEECLGYLISGLEEAFCDQLGQGAIIYDFILAVICCMLHGIDGIPTGWKQHGQCCSTYFSP